MGLYTLPTSELENKPSMLSNTASMLTSLMLKEKALYWMQKRLPY